MKRIGIIGFGNMGSALAIGLAGGDFSILISEKKKKLADLASADYDFEVISAKKELVETADIVVLAVKPQELDELYADLKGCCTGKLLISIIAGRSTSQLLDRTGAKAVARFMPNLAAKERKALVGVSFSDSCDAAFKKDCLAIAAAIGLPCEVPESLMPAITGLSGSGIAFVFAFFHAMALGGVKTGITYTQALEITLQVVEGAVAVIKKSGDNPMVWLSRVISPAGTTIQGIAELERTGFTHSVMKAVELAAQKAAAMES